MSNRLDRPEDALDTNAASAFLGGRPSPKTLVNWRCLGVGPAYVKYGEGLVAYLVEDLEAFRRSRRVATAGSKK
jgi:hypothetical protein